MADLLLQGRPAWHDDALCAQIGGDFWFPEYAESAEPAKRICRRCPVQTACDEWALENRVEFGIWGGRSERQRHRLWRRPADGEPT